MKPFTESSVRTYMFHPSDYVGGHWRCTAEDLQKAISEIAESRNVPVSELFISSVDVGSTRVVIQAWT